MRSSDAKVFMIIFAVLSLGCGPTGRWTPEKFFEDADVVSLANAAIDGDIKEIDRLIAKGVSVNAKGKDGMTCLLFALWAQKKSSFRRLLEHGADPNIQTHKGDSVTSLTARMDDSDWLKMALKHKADPNLIDPIDDLDFRSNQTPIFSAINGRNLQNLRLLIDAGADLDHQIDSGATPLLDAVSQRWYEGVYMLLLAGADYAIQKKTGTDLPMYCFKATVDSEAFPESFRARKQVLKFLEKKGVDLEDAKKRCEAKFGNK